MLRYSSIQVEGLKIKSNWLSSLGLKIQGVGFGWDSDGFVFELSGSALRM